MSDNLNEAATRMSWPKLKPMPKRHTTISLHVFLDEKQSKRLRQGFIPSVEEERWFAYFEDNTLYQHRSWTGICIDQVHFVTEGSGLRATHAEVNRHTPHYSNKDDQEDIERITKMVLELADLPLGAKSRTVDPMVTALQEAVKPNYLGSPDVIHALLAPFFDAQILDYLLKKQSPQETNTQLAETKRAICLALSGNDRNYVTMPWHSAEQLGQAAIRYFELNKEHCSGQSLEFILAKSIDAVALILGNLIRQFAHGKDQKWERDVAPHLERLMQFTGTVLLGTNTIFYPNETIKSIIPQMFLNNDQDMTTHII